MDSLFGRIRSGANRAGHEADKLRRINAIKGEIKGLTAEISQKFYHVGQVAYQLYRQDQIAQPELTEICAQLAAMQRQILEKEQAIEQIRQEEFVEPASPAAGPLPPGSVQCPNGHGALPQQARFCPVCGSPGEQVQVPSPEGRFCPNCGTGLAPGGRFCPSCGASVPAAPSTTAPAVDRPVEEAVAEPLPDLAEAGQDEPPEESEEPELEEGPEEISADRTEPGAGPEDNLELPAVSSGDETGLNEEDQVEPSQQFCNECGAALVPEAMFCPDCGQPIA